MTGIVKLHTALENELLEDIKQLMVINSILLQYYAGTARFMGEATGKVDQALESLKAMEFSQKLISDLTNEFGEKFTGKEQK